MSIDATRWAWGVHGIRPTQKLVLLAVSWSSDVSNVGMTTSEIAAATGLNIKTVRKAIYILKKNRYVLKYYISGNKKKIFYASWGGGKQMKWFKHMSQMHMQESAAEVLDTLGPEGYGVYMLILEVIAGKIDESGQASARFSIKFWSNFCRISAKKFQKIVRFWSNLGELTAEFSENFCTITCDKLLNLQDEWTRKKVKNSGVTPERLRSKDIEVEIEVEEDKEYIYSCSELSRTATEPPPEPAEEPALSAQSEPVDAVITLPLNTGSEHPVTAGEIAQWAELYPAVDVGQELRHMRGWLLGNPKRRKTKNGIGRFIQAWLAKEQDKPRRHRHDDSGLSTREARSEELSEWYLALRREEEMQKKQEERSGIFAAYN